MSSDCAPITPATVFLAHSSQDIKVARQVRNLFEERDHDVLLLKLSQAMSQEYLRELLTNEIQARDWLVMLRSQQADSSTWVAFERHFAAHRQKPVFEIETGPCTNSYGSECQEHLRKEVAAVSRRLRVYLSYRFYHLELAKRIAVDLRAKGFEAYLQPENLRSGDNWQDSGPIDAALEHGAVVLLASDATMQSHSVLSEIDYALSKNGRIIPCLAARLTEQIPFPLDAMQWIDFLSSYEHGFKELLNRLCARSKPYHGGA